MKAATCRCPERHHQSTLDLGNLPDCPTGRFIVNEYRSQPLGRISYTWWLRLLQGVLLFVVLGFLPGLVLALPAEIPNDLGAGSLYVRSAQGGYQEALRLQSDVHFAISGMVLRATLKQYFRNDSQQWMEGIYVFPLPDHAAVDRLRIHVGERIIEGVIKERKQARALYVQAKREGKRSALVEQERPNMFTTSVANIAPGETVVVEIAYQQTLEYRDGRFSLDFPMTITPRYIPGAPLQESSSQVMSGNGWARNSDQVPDASRITPPMVRASGQQRNMINISASLDAGFPLAEINSLYHDIRIDRQQQQYRLKLQRPVAMDRDFELVWTPAVGNAPNAAFFKQTLEGEDYGLIMIMPPQADQAQRAQQAVLPREVILVIDTSGSMAGQSIEQARQALLMALDTLTPTDRFNVIEFNSTTRKLFTDAVFADSQSLMMARRFVSNLRSSGGTEMADALRAALGGDEAEGFVRQVIFITDGSVGNEKALFNLIEDRLGNSRLFTVGIGAAPNAYFMHRAAEFGRGSYTFVRTQDEIAARMQTLFERLSSPLLGDLQIDWSGTLPTEVWPQRISDLYSGEPVLVAVKLNPDNDSLTLRGKTLNTSWQRQLKLDQYASRDGIAAIWARKKIAQLMDEQRRQGSSEQLRTQIVDLALHHRLVSKYTSLVAIDSQPVRAGNDALNSAAIPNNMPAGSQQAVPTSGFPVTATSARMHLLIAMLGLLLLIILVFRNRYEA